MSRALFFLPSARVLFLIFAREQLGAGGITLDFDRIMDAEPETAAGEGSDSADQP